MNLIERGSVWWGFLFFEKVLENEMIRVLVEVVKKQTMSHEYV